MLVAVKLADEHGCFKYLWDPGQSAAGGSSYLYFQYQYCRIYAPHYQSIANVKYV